MPIRIDKKLPAVEILRTENIFVMDDQRAAHQDIRPLKILILNLMPQKMVTETQLLRHLANTPLQLWPIHPYNWISIFSIWRATVLKQLVQSTWKPSIKLFLKSKMSILMG